VHAVENANEDSDWRDFIESALAVGDNEIVRIENNRDFPERGAVRLIPHGGA
jgi:hypothetical protein